jgi:hypothetical protein
VPPNVNNPAKRKELIEKIHGHESVVNLRPVGDKLVVKIDDLAAKDFCKSVSSVLNNSKPKLMEKSSMVSLEELSMIMIYRIYWIVMESLMPLELIILRRLSSLFGTMLHLNMRLDLD